MQRSALFGLALFFAFGTAGCNLSRITGHSRGYTAPRAPIAFALAVTVHGGLQPTPAQWATIQAKMADVLATQNAVLVTDISLADRIIRLDFQPNPVNPDHSGHLTLLGVRTNPYYGAARSNTASAFVPAFGFANSFMRTGWWGSSNYYSGDYFNYMGPWENGYTSGGTVTTIPKPAPPTPHHRHRGDRELCPPDTLTPGFTPGYASSARISGTLSAGTMSSPSYTSPETPRRWTGEHSAWRPAAGGPRSERAYARSENSSGRSGRSYSSSDNGSSRSSYSRSERSYSRSDSDASWRSSRDSGYSPSYSDSSSYSSPAPVYTSPSPPSNHISESSGTLTASSSSSSSSSSGDPQP
jgi:hypothetical protein